jgi:beta-N-acetylhexosaminidase
MSRRRTIPTCALAALIVAAGAALPGQGRSAAAEQASTSPSAAPNLVGMSLEQEIGQLFMVGTPADGSNEDVVLSQIDRYHLGNVFLSGRSSAGVAATASVVARLRAAANGQSTAGVLPLVGTDQEGGYVQVLSGPGFTTIPTALTQGSWPTGGLQLFADVWGQQLRAAGINLNLAPVTDLVPSPQFAPANAPIGYYQREFGFNPFLVATHSVSFTKGMNAGGVATVAKHFPGLGYVTANTDTTVGVTDSVTTRRSAPVAVFDAAITYGTPVVMVSSAIYSKIDSSRPAMFSPTIVTGMLRDDAHFGGVIMSDSMAAAALSRYPVGDRAVNFLDAGGNLVLTTDPTELSAMVAAVTSRAQSDPAFRAKVDASAQKILLTKAYLGLTPR